MKGIVSIWLLIFCVVLSACGSQKQVTRKKKPRRTASKSSKQNDYPSAIKSYTKQLASDPNNVKIYVDRGNAYYAIKEYSKSEQDFIKAISIDPNYSEKVYLYAATVQRLQNKFSLAADSYSKYLETCDSAEASCQRAVRYQKEASFASEAIANPVEFNPVRLSENINTTNSQYLPHFTIDGQKMIYTERVSRQEDLYVSTLVDGKLSKGIPIEGLNTPYNEGAHCITPDGRQIIFTVCDDRRTFGSCDLYGSQLTTEGWTKPRNLGKEINSEAWDSQPTISGDGMRLYFSSRRSGGQGGSDLYVATLSEQGWGNVQNLGPQINSNKDDESPFIHQDNRTLYFRSNGHIGMGDFDLFIARRANLNEEFSSVKNLGYPINSAGNDGGLYVSLDGSKGYFASDQSFHQGEFINSDEKHLDIYSFDIPISAKPNPVTYFKAKVIDAVTKQEIGAKFIIKQLDNGEEYLTRDLDAATELIVPIPVGENYIISVEKEGYLYHSENFSLEGDYAAANPMEKTILLTPIPAKEEKIEIAESKPVILNNIFFETGSATLKPESSIEIENLVAQLQKNSNLKIKILGHTDNVGSDTDNLKLSDARANAVYKELIAKGVSASRLAYEGRGESQPIATNDTAEGRQTNRRTEFIITGV